MEKYGVVDIGSNTVVLLIYGVDGTKLETIYHHSDPVHLVSYQKDGHMSQEGIDKTKQVLMQYHQTLMEYDVKHYRGFITEPWRRLDNAQEMKEQFEESGIQIDLLSGREEAEYDFFGASINLKDYPTGNAFDVGGGSTELISFKNHEINEAISFPLGCVRLSQLNLLHEALLNELQKQFQQYPKLLDIKDETIIGIGGTVRAAGKLCDALYHTKHIMQVSDLKNVYQALLDQDEHITQVMHDTVNEGRWNVFAPGLSMVLAICEAYNVKQIRISKGCVREGYLMKVLLNQA